MKAKRGEFCVSIVNLWSSHCSKQSCAMGCILSSKWSLGIWAYMALVEEFWSFVRWVFRKGDHRRAGVGRDPRLYLLPSSMFFSLNFFLAGERKKRWVGEHTDGRRHREQQQQHGRREGPGRLILTCQFPWQSGQCSKWWWALESPSTSQSFQAYCKVFFSICSASSPVVIS